MVYKKKIKFEWENISDATYRAKVYGGWVLTSCWHSDNESMVFISDPNWEWTIDNDKE